MLTRQNAARLAATGLALALSASTLAQDWHNAGGNRGRNAQSPAIGPDTATSIWSGAPTSLIAWQPVIEGDRVFMVRQSGWPSQEPNKSPVVALDLNSGEELWVTHIPFETGDWTTWVGGVYNGIVYAGRSGNGASVWAPLYALDAATGDILWISEDEISAGAYDGVVFAPNGDPIVGSFHDLWRISAADGTTVWHSPRTGSVSGTCGAAATEEAVYVADAAAGGNTIVRFDMATGFEDYESELMSGFTIQNTPMVGPDGTIYLSRTQNNPSVDYFYALEDDGTQITIKWFVPAAWTTTSEFGVAPDGGVLMMAPGYELVKLNPDTGDIEKTSGPLSGFSKPRMVVDAWGRVYLSNGAFGTGRLYAFDDQLNEMWSTAVTNVNIGGPAMGHNGVLVICGVGTDVRAYYTSHDVPGDMDCDGDVDFDDIDPFVLALSGEAAYYAQFPECNWLNGDIDDNGAVDFDDINPFVSLIGG